jgi:flavin reductase (DIM6/NTAB) family NADH-FMN oxidoreductase RutF
MTSSSADAKQFRQLMARWATGVSVVTVPEGGRDYGLTVNAFLSVSLEPPTLLISLSREADTTPVLDRARVFAVNLLAFDQRAISERFASTISPEEKFADLRLSRGVRGAALLPETLGALEAEVTETHDAVDHRLYLGRVLRLHPGREALPLLFYHGRYAESDGVRSLSVNPA